MLPVSVWGLLAAHWGPGTPFFLLARCITMQWSQLTAALFSSQPMTDVLAAARWLVSKWMPVRNTEGLPLASSAG